jgi:hypothetical protein
MGFSFASWGSDRSKLHGISPIQPGILHPVTVKRYRLWSASCFGPVAYGDAQSDAGKFAAGDGLKQTGRQ